MFESHFRLERRPFRASPDVPSYFPSAIHDSALKRITSALQADAGVCLLTGAPGTGKTLIAQCLIERLAKDFVTAFLPHSHLANRVGLLQAISFELGASYVGKSEQELRLALVDLVLTHFGEGRRTLLVVDEAQNLDADLLEELRLLLNLESGAGKAVQLVLAAQPEIEETLRSQSLRALDQRLAVRVRLEPLAPGEGGDFLRHQLRFADGEQELLHDDAVGMIVAACHGNPRVLNQVASQALTLAFEAGSMRVDVEAVTQALAKLRMEVGAVNDSSFPALVSASEAVNDGTPPPSRKRRRGPAADKPIRRPA
jgi:general secretion pathway protein A